MKHKLKCFVIAFVLILSFPITTFADESGTEEHPFGMSLISPNHILVDVNTGIIIYGNGIHERAYPASMTKVMTALLLIESGKDMDERIHHSHTAIFSTPPGSSHIAMDFDETLSVKEALHALMLPSANEVSNAVAEFVGGTMEEFALMMTARAHELGAVNTNFTNAHGFWEPNHYTTAYDMFLIMQEAVAHEIFREIIGTGRFDIPPTEKQPEYRVVFNTNRMIFPANAHFNPDIVGGKTGFTTPSRHTLVSYAQRGDIGLISVVLRAENRDAIFSDTTQLMNFGFDSFEDVLLMEQGAFEGGDIDLIQRVGREGIRIGNMPVRLENAVYANLPSHFDGYGITMTQHLSDRVWVPVGENVPIGRLDWELNGALIASVRLVTASNAEALNDAALAAMFPARDYGDALRYDAEYYYTEASSMIVLIIAGAGVMAALYLLVKVIKFLSFGRGRRAPYGYVRRPSSRGGDRPSSRKYRYR